MSDAAEVLGMFVGMIVLIFVIAFLVGMVMAWPLMWIWNWMMPDLFDLPTITYWQAFWGSFMAKLIFPNSAVTSSSK